MTVLRVSGITKRFGATIALDGVDLELRAGEVHALIGENGAGKSTLMNVLAGAVQPDSGEMEMDGEPFDPTSPLSARRRGIALIHQELSLCPHLSVAENILLGSEPSRLGHVDVSASRRRAAGLLEEFGHAEIRTDAIVGRLSLAARQVVEICRALASNARIVLMDEPTSSFQREDTERVFALVRRLAARGISVVYISHFLEEVREVADRYTVLRDGRTVASGSITSVTNEQLITQMVGRSISGLFPRRVRAGGEIALSVCDLTAPGIDGVSFDLRSGEILGIAGLIGSGRTELIRALFGLEGTSSGEIVVRGRVVQMGKGGTARRLAAGFGYLSEDRKGEGLALPLSVADNLTLTRLSAFGNRWGWLDLGRQRERARSWIQRLHIRVRTPQQPVRTLSGGNQQKVALGRLLHQDATILLLDDPTRGIDIASKEQVYNIITAAADAGKAVLMVSSYLPELFGLCDRLAVMRRGRLSEPRPIDAWTPETVLAAAIGEEPHALNPSAF
ncbi:MAG TPA: sugar ABC transporter ATP-binding protein [Gemmatimonadaceae bacterium]|jgi:ribose transport system ATP-binding protein